MGHWITPLRSGICMALGAVLAPYILYAAQPDLARNGQPDAVGGYASTHIVVHFTPGMMERVAASPVGRGSDSTLAHADMTPELQAACARWAVTRVRPWYPFPFKNPALAAKYGFDRTFLVDVPRGTDTPAMAVAFRALNVDIEAADVDSIGGVAEFIPNDPEFSSQYSMHNTGQNYGTVDADIDAPEAWEIHTGEAGAVTVAIIDGGVTPHPDFGDRMVPGINTISPETPNYTVDGCGDGHGTLVAGVVAARGNNDVGIAGVAWGARIMPVRVLNFCTGPVSATSAGLIWAVDHGADVCHLSLGFYDLEPTVRQDFENAVNYAQDQGVIVIASAGNNGECRPGEVSYPAAFDHAIAVSGTDENDEHGAYSCYGSEVELSAPGDRIRSTSATGGYSYASGTSMAAPHASGVAALVKSYLPGIGPDEVRSILQTTTDDLGEAGWDPYFGYGRINAHSAMLEAASRIRVASSWPPDGAIDARTPSELDGSNRRGWSSIELTFDAAADGVIADDFVVSVDGPAGAPAITNVIVNGDTVDLEFDRFIPVGSWTTVTYLPSGTGVRIGYAPGDVNGDGTSEPGDILALVDDLNHLFIPRLEIWQVDVDRNGVVDQSDIIREIDLLNGAGAIDVYYGATLSP